MPKPIEENMVIDTKSDTMYYSDNIVMGKSGSYNLAGKSKNQVAQDMDDVAANNNAGFNDWVVADYMALAPLFLGFKQGQATTNWTEFLVGQGWPGKKVDGATVLLLYNPSRKNGNLSYMLNDSDHFNKAYIFQDNGFIKNPDYCLFMVYRKIKPENYGYTHLKQ